MATAKTGSFYLTETLTLPTASASGSRVQGSIDLGAYVNVPTGQAVAIESVDFVHQAGPDFGGDVANMMLTDGAITTQLTDMNLPLMPPTFTLITSDLLHSVRLSWLSMILFT